MTITVLNSGCTSSARHQQPIPPFAAYVASLSSSERKETGGGGPDEPCSCCQVLLWFARGLPPLKKARNLPRDLKTPNCMQFTRCILVL